MAAGLRFALVANGHGDLGQVCTRGAGLVHVAPRQHGDLVHRPQQPERAGPRRCGDLLGTRNPEPARPGGPGADARAPLPRAPRDAHVRHTPGDGQGEMADRPAAPSPAVADFREEGDVAEAEVLGDGHLFGGLHGEGRQGVHFARFDPGVVQGRQNHAHREFLFAGFEVFGELRLRDADDGGAVIQPNRTPLSRRRKIPRRPLD